MTNVYKFVYYALIKLFFRRRGLITALNWCYLWCVLTVY